MSWRRPSAAIAVVLGLAALLCCFGRADPPVDGPQPDRGARAPTRRDAASSEAIEQPTASEPDVPDRERLHVWTNRIDRLHYKLRVSGAPLDSVIPSDDSAWDTTLLEQSSFAQTWRSGWNPYHRPYQLQEVLRAGRDTPLPEGTAEGQWQSLYSTWIEAEDQRLIAVQDYVDRHYGPNETWNTLTSTQRRDVLEVEPFPSFDSAALLDEADQTYTDFPDHPVTDHARLIESVAVLLGTMSGPVDKPWLDVYEAIEDEGLRTFALTTMIERSSFRNADAEVLDAVLAVQDPPVDLQARMMTWVAKQAAQTYRPHYAVVAEKRLRESLTETCAEVDEHQCTFLTRFNRDLAARLSAIGEISPSTWQEALTAEAWACEIAGNRHTGIAETTATWNGDTWTWGTWNRTTPGTSCLAAVTFVEPAPTEPVVVEIVYEHGR